MLVRFIWPGEFFLRHGFRVFNHGGYCFLCITLLIKLVENTSFELAYIYELCIIL